VISRINSSFPLLHCVFELADLVDIPDPMDMFVDGLGELGRSVISISYIVME
jgi:hypothetical protein